MRAGRAVCWSLLVALCACVPAQPGSAAPTPGAPATRMSPGRLDGLLAGLRPNPSADYGLVIEDLGSGERLALNETRVFPSGSVYKLALAWQVLREVDLDRIDLDQPLEILPEDTIEDEPVGGLSAPDTRTVHQALRAMFTVSSKIGRAHV